MQGIPARSQLQIVAMPIRLQVTGPRGADAAETAAQAIATDWIFRCTALSDLRFRFSQRHGSLGSRQDEPMVRAKRARGARVKHADQNVSA